MKTFIVWAQELIGDERGNSELEDKSIEIMKSKEQRKKKQETETQVKNNRSDIRVIGVPESEEK